mgnify:CR=1 FL=1
MQNKAFKFRLSELTQTTGVGFVVMVLSFIIMFAVEVFHYREPLGHFTGFVWAGVILAFLMSLCIQLARVFFGIMGIEDFANGHKKAAFFGLTISIVLAILETISVMFIGQSMDTETGGGLVLKFGLTTMVWIGFATELRLCFAYAAKMGKSERSKKVKQNGKSTQKELADFAIKN